MTLKEHVALDFSKNIAERPWVLLLKLSQNNHISFWTIQFCCEIQHLNTFLCVSLNLFLLRLNLKKKDRIHHGPGCFKAESNRECLILSVAVCNPRRLCNQACEVHIWRKDSVSDHILIEVHPLAGSWMCWHTNTPRPSCGCKINIWSCRDAVRGFQLTSRVCVVLKSRNCGCAAISLLTFVGTRAPQGLTLQWWMCSVVGVWGPTQNPGIPLGPFQLQLNQAPHYNDMLF